MTVQKRGMAMGRPVKWRRVSQMPEVLEQEDCAGQMQISRPMFQHILMNARQKIADSLIHGKGIRIEGGTFTRNVCPVQCLPCGKIWVESSEVLRQEKSHYLCPDCGSDRIVCAPDIEQAGQRATQSRSERGARPCFK
jgi:predicted RNA-binding Zn-ribbon protein involved in translation (DUF1610 family)